MTKHDVAAARLPRICLVKPELPAFDEVAGDFRAVLESGRLTNFGPYSQRLERDFAGRAGVAHAAAVSNATTGLVMLLNCLPPGSEVLVPSFTFLPTVQAIVWNGHVPVFVDVDPLTFTISPELVEQCITERTRAILGVHAFGAPADVDRLSAIAQRHGLRLFFDSAHACGARWRGAALGGFGDAEVFSLSATKVLPCGEGGLVTSNDAALMSAIRDRRNYGFSLTSCRTADRPANGTSASLYECANLGLNGKLTEFAAILGVYGLESLDRRVRRRQEIAQRYREALGTLRGISFQHIDAAASSCFKDFVIVVDPGAFGIDRDTLRQRLHACCIETAAYFCPAVHQFEYFQRFHDARRGLPVTERLQAQILSLPVHAALSEQEQDSVISCVRKFSAGARR